ncbi:hypothetical protein KMZ32_05980 [Phycicoccus sp. MAQZ13P-2]|uniref:hypothetical protein n=1 Tax=Phycicoccus mangrovi TaxID=2840470 RepID=UPI001BFFE014|nr:hypothetical protein [Phycicoccus mangrovi]MBT9273622.1 hypothetical protein [Phycicoccus mangrovi]
MTWPTWAADTWANVLAGLALAVAVVGFVINRASAKGADDKASRAAAAAERSAVALEQMARAAEAQQIQAALNGDAPRAAWRLTHFQGVAFELENVGRAPAYEVLVEAADPSLIVHPPPSEEMLVVETSETLKFAAKIRSSTTDDRVLVSWAEAPGGRRHDWRRALPPKV